MVHSRSVAFMAAFIVVPLPMSRALEANVQARIEISHPESQNAGAHHDSTGVVLWLTQEPGGARPSPDPITPGHFRVEQKNKSFNPHLLVVPLGSTVDFPNRDPFFHNVFSQFNGKRFDLGLYEAGSSKSVHFDHEGVSYIFCNIHSQMAAVIVTLATRYFSVTNGSGLAQLHDVPPGDYEMHVWAEGADAKQLETLSRRVHIGSSPADLGTIRLSAPSTPVPHKNKFGEDYKPDHTPDYR